MFLARNYWNFFDRSFSLQERRTKWAQLESQETKWVCRLYFTSEPPQTQWFVFAYLSGAVIRRRKWLCSSGDILPLCSGEGERPAHTKDSLTPSHCLFLVITSTTIESMGQGEARTLVRGGCPRNNKQMFFDDNCRKGKRECEGGLVKPSLVEAAPPQHTHIPLTPLKLCAGM